MRDVIRIIGWIEFIAGVVCVLTAAFIALTAELMLAGWLALVGIGGLTGGGVLVMFVDLVNALAPERQSTVPAQSQDWTNVSPYNRPHALNIELEKISQTPGKKPDEL